MASDEVPDGWVRLNVGGRIFVTMKQTLSSSPFFARLFESDDRMPDATAGSPTHFVDRDPDRFAKLINYLRDGTLLAEKNWKLRELRLEADFYGLDNLVRVINETKAQNELRSTTKCGVVSREETNRYGDRFIKIAINPREEDHFLLRYLQQRYPCRVRTPSFQFPYGFTFELRTCSACPQCESGGYDYHCSSSHCRYSPHGCVCAPNTTDTMLKDVVAMLESRGYVMDRNVDAIFTASGRVPRCNPALPTSWTFVKREY